MSLKKFLPFLPALALVLAGCATTTVSRLTPNIQPRNSDNLYPVEVSFSSQQQSMRRDSIQPYVLINGQTLPMRAVPMVKDRWEGLVPVPATADSVTYRIKFDYLYNVFGGAPQKGSELSPNYTLKIVNQ